MLKLKLRLWIMVYNFETETFPSWYHFLRLGLRHWIRVSNFETETLAF